MRFGLRVLFSGGALLLALTANAGATRTRLQTKEKVMTTTQTLAPTGLLCDLMAEPEKASTSNAHPTFGWTVPASQPHQTAYEVLVATSPGKLVSGQADMWNSGKVESSDSLNCAYAGIPLASNATYYWKVRTWGSSKEAGPWSEPQCFHTGKLSNDYATPHYPLERFEVAPVEVADLGGGHFFIDFGRAAFGTLRLTLTSPDEHAIEVHLGEARGEGKSVPRTPAGTIRYRQIALTLKPGTHTYTVTIPPDQRNTGPRAIAMPADIGEVLPFRYCELVNCPAPLAASAVRQIAVRYSFNRDAATFSCSSETLNRVWELCKHTIEATSFCGLYVDGDRERIPYEADAYINQLCHYGVDREFTLARRTHEYLLTHPAWPTEWILHSVLMAWADYEYTGDTRSLAANYETLRAKTLDALARRDGLISTTDGRLTTAVMDSVHYGKDVREFFKHDLGDIVDWPPGSFTKDGLGERDGCEMLTYNTVVNAFHYHTLILMERIANSLDKLDDARAYAKRAELVRQSFQHAFFDNARGVYVDGEGSHHSSLHANMFPLALGLVPAEHRTSVTAFVKSRGMACSVYGSQYLLDALYEAGEDTAALGLMTSEGDRSWVNMLRVGSTMTLEAWDWKYKNNLDWNHAWGAAPANIIPRWLMGVRPLEPGFGRILIQPQPGDLTSASMHLPTIRGTVGVEFENRTDEFVLRVDIPGNVTAKVGLPCRDTSPAASQVEMDSKPVQGAREGRTVFIDNVPSGRHVLRVK